MPILNEPQVDVTIKGAPGKTASIELKGVNSIMEIPNEVEGVIKGISFYHNNHWQDFGIEEFETIIIRRCKNASPKTD